jgi:putative restriction endonuclease
MKNYNYYNDCFTTLHTARIQGFFAPHKPLLLLSVMDLIEQGMIYSNRIDLSDELVDAFRANTAKYICHSKVFAPSVGQPFYHMQHEPFWQLVPKEGAEPSNTSYSVNKLRTMYRYALIDEELFQLLQDADARARLRVALISKYFTSQPSVLLPIALVPTLAALLQMIA